MYTLAMQVHTLYILRVLPEADWIGQKRHRTDTVSENNTELDEHNRLLNI